MSFELRNISYIKAFIQGFFSNTFKDEFGKDCTVFWKSLDENDQIYVGYNGRYILSFCDDYSFQGKGDGILDEYEVCITPVNFTDPDSAVRLDYKTYGYKTLQNVTCTENYNKKYCGPQSETLYIDFEKRNKKDTSNAKFKLRITTNKVFDYGDVVGAIIGGVVGGIVLIALLTGLVCWCVCRRKLTQGQVLNPGKGNQSKFEHSIYCENLQKGFVEQIFDLYYKQRNVIFSPPPPPSSSPSYSFSSSLSSCSSNLD
ncbi:uncharacterized protein LOC125656142 [Ostrea edulis]|uniref:uncharacterized protein LOC125656142 n=1 Tax=Ostrea edulis TaxID=37623 RepID=UPI0024AF34D4|nr:uncharacterized protein LOC125656142 [Ostrea edulis]